MRAVSYIILLKSEVILLDKVYNEIFSRNIGIFSESEQEKLKHSTIAISGVGGVGGRLKITDPGTFEKSNFNRQFGSSTANLNRNKAEEVFHQIKDINPQAKIDYSTTGIASEGDAIQFVSDSDLIIDEMDFGLFKESISLQRAARQRGIFYFFTSAIGFGAVIVVFAPEGLTLEEFDNVPSNVDINSIEKIHVPLKRIIPILPSYTAVDIPTIFREIDAGIRAAPTTSIGAGLASVLAAMEAVNIILKKKEIVVAPQYKYIDLFDQRFVVGNVS
jgi:molybdopterin/thiamine biosynthesis adenylyltransferase